MAKIVFTPNAETLKLLGSVRAVISKSELSPFTTETQFYNYLLGLGALAFIKNETTDTKG